MTRTKVTLAKGRARPVWMGHPWVYSGAIASVGGDKPSPGVLADVYDHHNQFIGTGTFNPDARIAIRMLSNSPIESDIGTLIKDRVQRATALRHRLGLPNENTTAFRLINGEGDDLPGVICDVLGDLASIQLTTAAAETWLALLMEAIDAPHVRVQVPNDSARFEGIAPGDRFGRGDLEEHIEFKENGITWKLKPGKGQKTGFYTDQRENRRQVGALSAGQRVLDAFCYTGGFALNAARAGATQVVGVDTSGPSISVASGTAKANGLSNASFHKADVMNYLKGLGSEMFEVIVLDPPKLARTRHGLEDALKKYRAFNTAALGHLAPEGILVTCSCSSMVDTSTLIRMVTDAAHRAERRLTLLNVTGPGTDHPTPLAFDEGRYLNVITAKVA